MSRYDSHSVPGGADASAVKDQPDPRAGRQAESGNAIPGSFTFTREDWTLFRSLPSLCQKAGVPQNWLLRLVLKELTDNALDAGDAVGMPGAVTVGELEGGGYFVEDPGPGLAGGPEAIALAFSIRRPLMSSKVQRLPTRGALGNGLRVVAGAVQATDGSLAVCTLGQRIRVQPQDDGTSRAVVEGAHDTPGTRIEIRVDVPGCSDSDPLAWARDAVEFAPHGARYAGRSSPHWYEPEAFFELCQAAGSVTVRDLVASLEGCSGGKSGRIADGLRGRTAASLSRDEVNALLQCAKDAARPVVAARLGGVGPVVEFGAHAKTQASFTARSGRGGASADIPVVLEAWARLACRRELRIFVNRTPVATEVSAYQSSESRAETDVFGCGLGHRVATGREPLSLTLSVTTPWIPLASDGKTPDLSVLAGSIVSVLGSASRKSRRSRPGGTVTSQKQAVLDVLDEATGLAGGEGEHRFSLRQLYYAVRPMVLDATGSELKYDNFERIITDYESDFGEVEGMYRDPRGVLYHPHLREEIPVGTLSVEGYERPPWTFSKVLYIEKEGFFPLLRDARWPEIHDCALLSSKGYASRAARDLLDFLSTGGEPVTLFCVHDADGPGTKIFEALQDETAARPGRVAKVINLGLDPEEALEMDLEVECIERKGAVPVAGYVDDEWREWLQGNRVELNAMTTPQFLSWLTEKIRPYETGKLVPPAGVLDLRLRQEVETIVRDRTRERLLLEAGYERHVAAELALAEPRLKRASQDLTRSVTAALSKEPADHWSKPVADMARQLARARGKR